MFLNTRKAEQYEGQHSVASQPVRDGLDYFSGKTEREIWHLFKKGHEGAFQWIYENYADLLFSYGARFTREQEVVLDCVHDLFVELRLSRKISETDSIKYYLLKAFRNKIRRTLEIRKMGSNAIGQGSFLIHSNEPSHEAVLIQRQISDEMQHRLRLEVNNLPARQREALYYFYQENMSYKQVADIMGFEYVRSARNAIYKALETLRGKLQY